MFEVIARSTPGASHTFPLPLHGLPWKFWKFSLLLFFISTVLKPWKFAVFQKLAGKENISLICCQKLKSFCIFFHFLPWGGKTLSILGIAAASGKHFGTLCHISVKIFLKNTKLKMFVFWGKVLQNIVNSGLRGPSGVWRWTKLQLFLQLKRILHKIWGEVAGVWRRVHHTNLPFSPDHHIQKTQRGVKEAGGKYTNI